MTSELSDRLRAWLATEGYPFELRVGRAFRDAGWDVFHAHHYLDPETDKLREIDVHAAFGPYVGDEKGPGMVGIHLVCECKVSQAKPWIVFTSRHGDERTTAGTPSHRRRCFVSCVSRCSIHEPGTTQESRHGATHRPCRDQGVRRISLR